jgi:putative transposase
LDALLPVLYLRGISTGDFQEALVASLGKDAPNLSPSVISRLTAGYTGGKRRIPRYACHRGHLDNGEPR